MNNKAKKAREGDVSLKIVNHGIKLRGLKCKWNFTKDCIMRNPIIQKVNHKTNSCGNNFKSFLIRKENLSPV